MTDIPYITELEVTSNKFITPPYIIEKIVRVDTVYKYNKDYGDDRICKCGHPYYRHFDPFEGNRSVGCKYCACYMFEEKI